MRMHLSFHALNQCPGQRVFPLDVSTQVIDKYLVQIERRQKQNNLFDKPKAKCFLLSSYDEHMQQQFRLNETTLPGRSFQRTGVHHGVGFRQHVVCAACGASTIRRVQHWLTTTTGKGRTAAQLEHAKSGWSASHTKSNPSLQGLSCQTCTGSIVWHESM